MSFAFTKDDLAGLCEDEKVAIMESLVVAVVTDGKMPASETAKFDSEVEAIDWGMEQSQLIALMTGARARVLALKTRDDGIAFIHSVRDRLSNATLREKVFRSMGAIMFADDDMAKSERNVLAGYATAFGLTHERFKVIQADIVSAPR